MPNGFDTHARDYRDIINQASRVSGEKYEFFIQLRITLMINKLTGVSSYARIQRILDFGCGIGAACGILELGFPQATIVGIDSSKESINEACHLKLSRTKFIHAGAESMSSIKNSMDLIYSNGVFHHIPPKDRAAILHELHSVVKPNGHIFIFENNPANPLMMQAMANNPLDINVRAVAAQEIANLMKTTGFRMVKVGYYFLFPHFLRFLRWSEPLFERLPLGAQYFVWAKRC